MPQKCPTDADRLQQAKAIADGDVLRVLHRRGWDVAKATANFRDMIEFRASLVPVTPAQLPSTFGAALEGAAGTHAIRLGGYSLCGYPVLYVDGEKWRPQDCYSVDEALRYVFYFLEAAVGMCGAGVDKIMLVVELAGFNARQTTPFALRCLVQALKMNQNVFSGRLAAIFLMRPPMLFNAVWNTLRPMLDDFQKRRLHFVPQGQELRTLKKFIAEDAIPESLGGSARYAEQSGSIEEEVDKMRRAFGPPAFIADAPNPLLGQTAQGQEQEIAARAVFEHAVAVEPAHGLVTWSWSVHDKDIGFQVVFVPAGASDVREVVTSERHAAGEDITGRWENTNKEKGVLTLRFDNSYSRMTGKTITFRASAE
eukprot:TRINITY_DN4433_c0_g1_i4.p1 TRINITY_DN4433_c0_g1~~TRINITY_DN4433_c0_g1_i4.p1  ORF type:complete len:368 (-),score=82.89 TRINITY_DN4433_c0_g1_i4:80-1183(-)